MELSLLTELWDSVLDRAHSRQDEEIKTTWARGMALPKATEVTRA